MSIFRHSLRLCTRILVTKPLPNTIDTKNIARWVAPTLREFKRRKDKIGPEVPEPRSSFLEWNYDAEIFAFGKRLGEEFKPELLRQALINRSYVIQKESEGKSNEDFVKDGEILISDYIKSEYEKYYPKVVVDALHRHLTSDAMLAHVAKHMGLTDIILTAEYPVSEETLANTFKAVISALQQSQNLQTTQIFIRDFVMSQMNGKDIYDIWNPENPVEYLSLLLKKQGINEFEPRLCRESASNTILANYQVGFYHNEKLLGIGWGESVQIAKETAALDAIQRIHEQQQR